MIADRLSVSYNVDPVVIITWLLQNAFNAIILRNLFQLTPLRISENRDASQKIAARQSVREFKNKIIAAQQRDSLSTLCDHSMACHTDV